MKKPRVDTSSSNRRMKTVGKVMSRGEMGNRDADKVGMTLADDDPEGKFLTNE